MEKTFFWHGLFFGLLLLLPQNIQGIIFQWPEFANLHPDNTNNLTTLPSFKGLFSSGLSLRICTQIIQTI
ncbi:membrane protein E6A [Equid gammaherpesvirus 2]|nr:membrane protein E6A [Equid gammaherpesvirus 2]